MLLSLLSFIFSQRFVLCVTLLSPVMYFVLNSLAPLVLGTQDLKKKYGAKWALVTGSSSGIGKELARKLLFQGINVILVARDEPLFDDTVAELKALFPQRQVLQVGANLSDESGKWMADVQAAVGDKSVQCVFLNAGYILTGMYEANPVDAQLKNLHCNLTSNIFLSHFLYSALRPAAAVRRKAHCARAPRLVVDGCARQGARRPARSSGADRLMCACVPCLEGRLLASGERGCVVFTSSSGARSHTRRRVHPAPGVLACTSMRAALSRALLRTVGLAPPDDPKANRLPGLRVDPARTRTRQPAQCRAPPANGPLPRSVVHPEPVCGHVRHDEGGGLRVRGLARRRGSCARHPRARHPPVASQFAILVWGWQCGQGDEDRGHGPVLQVCDGARGAP